MEHKRRGNPNWMKKTKDIEKDAEITTNVVNNTTNVVNNTTSVESVPIGTSSNIGSENEEPKRDWKKHPPRERRPMYLRTKLDFSKRAGYHRRIVNDTDDGRVQRFIEAGYAIVQQENMEGYDDRTGSPHQMGNPVRVPVGQKKNGEALYGVLMEIPDEWYQEDHNQKQSKISENEKARLKNPTLMKDGFYGKVELGSE